MGLKQMRLHQFEQWLNCHTYVFEAAYSEVDIEELEGISQLAAKHGSVTVKTLASAIETVEVNTGEGRSCRDLSVVVNALVDATRTFGKADALKSLDAFAHALSKQKNENFPELMRALDHRLASPSRTPAGRTKPASLSDEEVKAYVQRLESALGEGSIFDELFNQLKNDKNVKAQDAKNIAKKFVGKAGKSKVDAFRLIYERHSSLMESQARAVSIGGRSAA
jgi:hypothetical protein